MHSGRPALGWRARQWVTGGDAAGVEQVEQENLDPADGEGQFGRDLHERHRRTAHLQDLDVLRLHPRRGVALGDDQRDDVERILTPPAPAVGYREKPVRLLAVDGPGTHDARLASRCLGGEVRWSPICSTSSDMLCPTRPTSASSAATTARGAPSPAGTISRTPPGNSTMDWPDPRSLPNSADALTARLCIPDAMADSWSALSTSRSSVKHSRRPSFDSTRTCRIPGVRSFRFCSSHSRSCSGSFALTVVLDSAPLIIADPYSSDAVWSRAWPVGASPAMCGCGAVLPDSRKAANREPVSRGVRAGAASCDASVRALAAASVRPRGRTGRSASRSSSSSGRSAPPSSSVSG